MRNLFLWFMIRELIAPAICSSMNEQTDGKGKGKGKGKHHHEHRAVVTIATDPHRLSKRWDGPTPTGSEILIQPTDVDHIPKHGFDIKFGPDIEKTLHTTLHVFCDHHNRKKCVQKLSEVLDQHGQLKHHKRASLTPGEIFFSALIAGTLYFLAPHKDPERGSDAHVASAAVADLDAHPSATEIVFKTGAKDKNPFTYPVPTKTTASHVSVKTIHSNKGKHHKGDVVVKVPKDAAHFLKQMLLKTDTCRPKTHGKRDPVNPDPPRVRLRQSIHQMFGQANGAMPMNELLPANQQPVVHLPMNHLPIQDAQQEVHGVVIWAENNHIGQVAQLPELEELLFVSIVFAYAYWYCIAGLNQLSEFVIPHNKKKDDKCPKGKNAPICRDCDGWKKGLCKKGKHKHCPCLWISVADMPYPLSPVVLNHKEKFLHKLLDGHHHEEPKTSCSDDKIGVEASSFKHAMRDYCNDHSPGKENGKTIKRDGYKFHFEHKWHTDECPRPKWNSTNFENKCKESFRQFFDDTKCSYSQHIMAKEGHLHDDCERSAFTIKKIKHKSNLPPDGHLTCFDDTGCYNEVNNDENVAGAAWLFVKRLKDGDIKGREMSEGDPPVHFDEESTFGTTFFAHWLFGCKAEFGHDIAEQGAATTYYDAWKQCDNGGRGGWFRKGCVAMGMRPVCSQ